MKNKSLLGLALLASTMTAANAQSDSLIDLLERIKTENVRPTELTPKELETVVRYYAVNGIPLSNLTLGEENQESIVGKIIKRIIEEEASARRDHVRCMSAANAANPQGSVRCMIEAREDREPHVRCMRRIDETTNSSIRCMSPEARVGDHIRCMRTTNDDLITIVPSNNGLTIRDFLEGRASGTIRCMRRADDSGENSERSGFGIIIPE